MLDRYGRNIDYVRISVTDRCNLRCVYCMPEDGVPDICHEDILRYEEIVRIVRQLAALGIRKVRLTGGEPLVRKDLYRLVAQFKAIPGIERVSLTTNGMLLKAQLPALVAAGLDGVNISIDAVSEDIFLQITRRSGVNEVLDAIDAALSYDKLSVKLNCVPTPLNRVELLSMASRFLCHERLSLRFIEMMPIGLGQKSEGLSEDQVWEILSVWGELTPVPGDAYDGPCRYYRIGDLPGKVGFISALSHRFCAGCKRIRLTADGFLKTCLQYDHGIALRPLLEGDDASLRLAMEQAVLEKPERHHFGEENLEHREGHIMSRIGG